MNPQKTRIMDRTGAATALAWLAVLAAGCSSSTNHAFTAGRPRIGGAAEPGAVVYVRDSAFARATAGRALPPDPFQTPGAATYWRRERGFAPEYPSIFGVEFDPTAPAPQLAMFGELGDDNHSGPGHNALSSDPVENLRQVSFAGEGADFDPVLSRDGTRLFFASTAHRSTPDIYVKSVDGKTVTQLTSDPASDIMPAVSPDGSRIAFASNRGGSWDLYMMNAEGGQAVQITSDSSPELHPTWSPDGKLLAYCRLNETSQRWEIWVTEADRNSVRRFLTVGLFPDWHPTLNKIAFQRARDRGDRFFSIWTIDYVNGEAVRPTEIATSSTAAVISPKWSPDGRYIACATVATPTGPQSRQRPEFADIWVMKSDGGGRANLTGGRYLNLMPAWGPENTVYFVSDRSGRDNIWSASSGQAIQAARGGIGADTASLTPDPHSAPMNSSMSAKPDARRAADSQEHAPEIANVPVEQHERR